MRRPSAVLAPASVFLTAVPCRQTPRHLASGVVAATRWDACSRQRELAEVSEPHPHQAVVLATPQACPAANHRPAVRLKVQRSPCPHICRVRVPIARRATAPGESIQDFVAEVQTWRKTLYECTGVDGRFSSSE